MVRIALCLLLATPACTRAQAPHARHVGEAMSLGGVAGLIVTAVTTHFTTSSTKELLVGFSVLSGVGIVTYAIGDLSVPSSTRETLTERNHRWAKILTERASGAARMGQCKRVRHIEARVRHYDSELHDFVFMRDPEIVKCLTELTEQPQPPPESPAPDVPAPDAPPDLPPP